MCLKRYCIKLKSRQKSIWIDELELYAGNPATACRALKYQIEHSGLQETDVPNLEFERISEHFRRAKCRISSEGDAAEVEATIEETRVFHDDSSQMSNEISQTEEQVYIYFGIEPVPLYTPLPPIPILYSEEKCPPAIIHMIDKYNEFVEQIWMSLQDWLRARAAFYEFQNRLAIEEPSWEKRKLLIEEYDSNVLSPHALNDALTTPFYKNRRAIQAEVHRAAKEQLGLEGPWVRERYLLELVRRALPNNAVYFRAHPVFLEGLELDIYVPDLGVGFEHQGEQHYSPVEFFGGKKSHLEVRTRDKKKRNLCKQNGVHLIEISFRDELTMSLVAEHLSAVLGGERDI